MKPVEDGKERLRYRVGVLESHGDCPDQALVGFCFICCLKEKNFSFLSPYKKKEKIENSSSLIILE